MNSVFQVLEGGVEIFGFGLFLGQLFGFCTENLQFFAVFRFCCPLQFPVFPFFSIWFFRFYGKNKAG